MKKLSLLLILLTLNVYSQRIESTKESLTLSQKTWLSENSFPISSYDYKYNDVNTLLEKSFKQKKIGKKLKTYGIIGAAAGLVLTFVGPSKNASSSANTTTALTGVTLMTGGIISWSLISPSKKRKARKNLSEANYLLSEKKLD